MRIFITLFVLLFTTSIFAQDVMPFSHKGKWGLADRDRNVILEPTYDHIGLFENKYQNKYSIFNKDNKYGLVSTKGEEVFAATFERINYDNNGHFFWTYDDTYRDLGLRIYSIKERKEVFYSDSLRFRAVVGDQYAQFMHLQTPDFKTNIILNAKGEEILRLPHTMSKMEIEFSPQDCPLLYVYASRHRAKLYECDGTPTTRRDFVKKYEIVEEEDMPMFEDMMVEEMYSEERAKKANEVIRARIKELFPDVEITIENEDNYHSGEITSVVVKQGGKYGIITKDGKIALPIEYSDIKTLRTNERILVVRQYASYGAYNVMGKELLPVQFRSISPIYRPKEFSKNLVEIITVSGYRGYADLYKMGNKVYLPLGVE